MPDTAAAPQIPVGHYVYTHHRADDRSLFYIGKGTRLRAWSQAGRNSAWKSAVEKHGLAVEIVKDGLTAAEALAMEWELIETHAHRDLTNARLPAPRREKPRRIAVSVDGDTHKRIAIACIDNDMTRQDFLERAVELMLSECEG